MGNAANIVFLTVYESDLWEPKWNMTKGWLEITYRRRWYDLNSMCGLAAERLFWCERYNQLASVYVY